MKILVMCPSNWRTIDPAKLHHADVVLLIDSKTSKVHVYKDRWGEHGRTFDSFAEAERHYAVQILASQYQP